MLQQGFRDRDGERVQGLRELLERLRRRRQDELERETRGRLRRDRRAARRGRRRGARPASTSSSRRPASRATSGASEVTATSSAEPRMQLDLLPPDLAGKVQDLQEYDFISSEAREQLRGADGGAAPAADARATSTRWPTPCATCARAAGAHARVLDALNPMLEQREPGEDARPTFEQFMEHFGDFFPGNPQSLDELLEQMAAADGGHAADAQLDVPRAARPAAGPGRSRCSRTWTCAGRSTASAPTCARPFPGAGWDRRYNFSGQDPLGLRPTPPASIDRLGEMDQLEQLLRSATSPGRPGRGRPRQGPRAASGDDGARSSTGWPSWPSSSRRPG